MESKQHLPHVSCTSDNIQSELLLLLSELEELESELQLLESLELQLEELSLLLSQERWSLESLARLSLVGT